MAYSTIPITLSFTNFELYNFGAEREGKVGSNFQLKKFADIGSI